MKNKWWGYKLKNGEIHSRRYFSQDDITEADESLLWQILMESLKEFDEKFPRLWEHTSSATVSEVKVPDYYTSCEEDVKSFLSATIFNILSAIEAEVEGMKDKQSLKEACPHIVSGEDKECFVCWENNGIRACRNSTLSDIQALLKSAKENIK